MDKTDGRVVTVLIAALMLALGGLALAQVKKGEKAPDFTLSTLDGKGVKLKPLVTKGKDRKAAIVVAFWGTWCGPCRAEAPRLQELYEKYEKQGLAVIGIAEMDSPRQVRQFVDACKLSYTIAVDSEKSPVALKYGVIDKRGYVQVPQLFLIDSDGVLREHHTGYALGSEKILEKEIKAILAEKPKT